MSEQDKVSIDKDVPGGMTSARSWGLLHGLRHWKPPLIDFHGAAVSCAVYHDNICIDSSTSTSGKRRPSLDNPLFDAHLRPCRRRCCSSSPYALGNRLYPTLLRSGRCLDHCPCGLLERSSGSGSSVTLLEQLGAKLGLLLSESCGRR